MNTSEEFILQYKYLYNNNLRLFHFLLNIDFCAIKNMQTIGDEPGHKNH